VDTGLRRACVTLTGQDRSKQLECATFLLLRRRFRDVAYWRGGGEVDFVIDAGRGPVPVQVSWEEASERARRGVDEFHEAHPTAGEPVYVTAAAFAAGVPALTCLQE
jgi:predicted AAA+ superfamily ATPase